MLGGLKQNLMHTRTESSLDYKHISVPVSSKHISKELGLKEKKKKKRKKEEQFFPIVSPETCVLPLTQLSHLGLWVIHRFSQVCGPANSPCTALQSPDPRPCSCGMCLPSSTSFPFFLLPLFWGLCVSPVVFHSGVWTTVFAWRGLHSPFSRPSLRCIFLKHFFR